MVSLRKKVLNFRQLEEESLDTSLDHFNELIITGLDHAIQDPVLLQHFYMGLSKDSMESLDAASRGAFLHLSTSQARSMLDKISGKTPYTSIHPSDDLVTLGEGIISRSRRGSFDSQITTTSILRFSYQSRTIYTPKSKSSKERRNSTF